MRISDWSSACALPILEGIGPLIRDPLRILLRRELFPVARLKRNVAMTADIIEMRGKVLRALLPPRNLDQHLRGRSEEHTSELHSLMRISYAVFCLKITKTFDNHCIYQLFTSFNSAT